MLPIILLVTLSAMTSPCLSLRSSVGKKSSITLVHVGTSLRHTVATPIQKNPSVLASVARFLSADILVRIGECSSMDAINCVVHCATLFAKLSNFNCMFAHSCQACKDGKHSCKLKCERTLFCGHQCGRDCHGSAKCPPCNKKCSAACVHSTCGGKCKNVVSHDTQVQKSLIEDVNRGLLTKLSSSTVRTLCRRM